jgi:zinc-binding alcohol dehydrogenase family protein
VRCRQPPLRNQSDLCNLVYRVKACSVNPIDIKARSKVYDDFPDYYDHVPKDSYQIFGYDGAGIVEAVGSEVTRFKAGDEVYYSGSPIRHGSNAECQLVAADSMALKPKNLDFVQAACMPLTWITAYEALVERMSIAKSENVAILIVNGAGGVGSVASQIASTILNLPVIITTTSRPETTEFSKTMGATHTVNHREDIPAQIKALDLDVPLKYIFLTHSTANYLPVAIRVCAPFGKICSIVQTQSFPQYGTEMMAKSLTFVWELLGTKPWYGVDVESHGRMLEDLKKRLEEGSVKCHHRETFPLTVRGLREAHEKIESGGSIGKIGLGVDVDGTGSAAFT